VSYIIQAITCLLFDVVKFARCHVRKCFKVPSSPLYSNKTDKAKREFYCCIRSARVELVLRPTRFVCAHFGCQTFSRNFMSRSGKWNLRAVYGHLTYKWLYAVVCNDETAA